ncbi:hypothetical protein V1477_001353 [Vespula maculifrons]|uniref:Uncharacterized protein n=1 Tax=Vespula maculifrons TaxID=7453 RepID=A0ABD2CZ12_VESMC
MCQIIKAEEEADAAHEFITNLPNDLSITIATIDINIEFYYTRYENIRSEEWSKKLEIRTEEGTLATALACIM